MDLLEKTHYFRRVLFHQQVQVVDYLALMVVTLNTWQKNMVDFYFWQIATSI